MNVFVRSLQVFYDFCLLKRRESTGKQKVELKHENYTNIDEDSRK